MLAPIGIIIDAAMAMGFMPPIPPPIIPMTIMPIGAIMLIGFIICDMQDWAWALPVPIRMAARAKL